MSFQFDDRIPIYLQIVNIIKKDIILDKLKPGDKLPSVREMSEILKVNPNTLQRAYQELEREEITYTQRGMGTFVTEDMEKVKMLRKDISKGIVESYVKSMKELNLSNEEIIQLVSEYLKGDKM